MKIRTRIATAVTIALATLFVGTPAFAHDAHESMYSSAGHPVNVVAILIIGLILLVLTLVSSVWIGNLFQQKK